VEKLIPPLFRPSCPKSQVFQGVNRRIGPRINVSTALSCVSLISGRLVAFASGLPRFLKATAQAANPASQGPRG